MKFDYKIIIILVLLVGVVGMIIFWPSNISEIDKHELDRLHSENEELLIINDSLYNSILEKDTIIFNAEEKIDSLNKDIEYLDSSIQNINNNRDEIRDNVNNLGNDAVVGGITDYLSRRKKR